MLGVKTQKIRKAIFFSRLALFLTVLGGVGFDQVSKKMAEKNLMLWSHNEDLRSYQGRRVDLWSTHEQNTVEGKDSWFLSLGFNYIRNQGAAWGMLNDWDDRFRVPFFYAVTLMAVLMIFLYLKTTPLSHRLARFSFILILSGAIGNFLDRVQQGYVIDFIDVRWVIPFPLRINFNVDFFPDFLSFLNFQVDASYWSYNFPNFNWADSSITIGVFLLLWDMTILDRLRRKKIGALMLVKKNEQDDLLRRDVSHATEVSS